MQPILEAIKSTYLVSGLTDEQLAEVAELATRKIYLPGQRIIRQGDTASDLYVLIDGRVNILTPDGDKLAEVGPGSVLGEIALIDARPRTADAVCIGGAEVAVFDAQVLRAKMNADRNMGFTVLANLSRVLCGRLRETNLKVDALMDKAQDTWHNAL